MAIRRWLFEGQASGTAVSTSNTPSETGENLSTVSAGTGGTIVYDSAVSFPAGGKSLKLTNGSAAGQIRFPFAGSGHTVGAIDATLIWPSEVPELRANLRLRHAAGYIFTIARNTSARILIQNVAGATVATGTVNIPLTARLDVTYSVAAGSNSNITVKVYNTAGTLLDTISVTGVDLGATAYTATHLEMFNSGTTVGYAVNIDSVAVQDGSSTSIGPYVPTVVAIAGVSAARLTNTTVSVSWTHPADAPSGVDILRVAGTQVNDASGRTPSDPAYDPTGLAGATTVATGRTSSPYTDTVPSAGVYTYWAARTP